MILDAWGKPIRPKPVLQSPEWLIQEGLQALRQRLQFETEQRIYELRESILGPKENQ